MGIARRYLPCMFCFGISEDGIGFVFGSLHSENGVGQFRLLPWCTLYIGVGCSGDPRSERVIDVQCFHLEIFPKDVY